MPCHPERNQILHYVQDDIFTWNFDIHIPLFHELFYYSSHTIFFI